MIIKNKHLRYDFFHLIWPWREIEKKYHCPFNNSYLSIPMLKDLILSLKIII